MLVSIELPQCFLITIYCPILIILIYLINPLTVRYVAVSIQYCQQHQSGCGHILSACPVISLELIHALRNVYIGLLSHPQYLCLTYFPTVSETGDYHPV